MRTILIILFALLMCSCSTLKSFEREKETIIRDTIVKLDTVYRIEKIKGATKTVYRDRILYDTLLIEKIKSGIWSTDTTEAHTKYAHAYAWIFNNKPFLKLSQDDIDIIVESYIERITILEKQLKEKETYVEKRYNFYENPWFWSTLVVSILLALGICFLILINKK